MTTAPASPPSLAARRQWLVPALLLLLAAVPVIAGGIRVAELAGGPEVTAENARFVAAPVPVLLHIVGATVYTVVGAFQFHPGLRRRRPRWHRAAGRVVAVAGIVAALTGVAMSLSYGEDGVLLTVLRVVFGTAMAAAIVLAVMAVRRRDIARHRAWMIRGYALGIAAGTQALVFVPWLLLVGTPGPTTTALLMGAGWVIDLVVAEWLIRRRPPRTPVAARPVRIRPATTGVVR